MSRYNPELHLCCCERSVFPFGDKKKYNPTTQIRGGITFFVLDPLFEYFLLSSITAFDYLTFQGLKRWCGFAKNSVQTAPCGHWWVGLPFSPK